MVPETLLEWEAALVDVNLQHNARLVRRGLRSLPRTISLTEKMEIP